MADITKCMGTNCPMKESCYRYTATDGMMQSYFVFSPFTKTEGKFHCSQYWSVIGKSIYKQRKDITKTK